MSGGTEYADRLREVEAELARMTRARDLAEVDKESAEARLLLVLDWVGVERRKRDNYNAQREGHGGQIAGDSHSPRLPPSVLLELERLVSDDRGTYAADGIRDLTERCAKAESALSSSEGREKALREALGAHVKDWRAAARIRRNAEPDVPFVAGRSEGYALALAICAGLVEDALRAALASDPDATRGGPTP